MVKLTTDNLTDIEEIVSWILTKQVLLHIDCEEEQKFDGMIGNTCHNINILNKNKDAKKIIFNL